MNKQEQEREDRLWEYIDGSGDNAARSEIERLLESHAEWREKYQELTELHLLLNQTELEAPSMRFTKNVMEEIAKYQVAPATRNYINKKVILGIGGAFAAIILVVLIYVFTQLPWTAPAPENSNFNPFGNLNLKSLNVESLNLGKWFSNTWVDVIVMINTVFGLVIFDMYLRRKKTKIVE